MSRLVVNQQRRSAFLDGCEIQLTPQEYRVLYRLAVRAGEVVLKEELLAVMENAAGTVRGNETSYSPVALDLVIFRLRRKLQESAQTPKHLETRRGVGYILHDASLTDATVEQDAARPNAAKHGQGERALHAQVVVPWAGLTRREWQLFMLLGDKRTARLTNRALAQELQMAEGTLKKHLQHLYRKLGVANRAAASLLANQARVR